MKLLRRQKQEDHGLRPPWAKASETLYGGGGAPMPAIDRGRGEKERENFKKT
jgi:hypothetical protein